MYVYSDIKSFITRDNKEEECNEDTEKAAEATEEPVCYISNYSEVVNQIKKLALFTLQKSNIDDFNLFKKKNVEKIKI